MYEPGLDFGVVDVILSSVGLEDRCICGCDREFGPWLI